MTESTIDVPAAEAALPAAATASTRNPFVTPNYRKWWTASIVAGTGVGIQAVTVPLFIKDRVGEDTRAIAIAAALISQTLPAAAFALVGGVVADRLERRRILVRTYTVAAAVSCAYVALAGLDVRAIWPVFILAAIVGCAGAFTNPARQSMTPQILQTSQLQNGVILGTMAFTATLQFGGPTVGGLLADGVGLTVAFAVEVAALACAAILFSRIATDLPVRTGRSVRGDLADGLRYVRTSPSVLGILFLGTIPGVFLMGPFAVTVVIMVEDVLGASDKFVGILWGCFGAGILIGSILMTLVRLPRRGLFLCSSLLLGGVTLAAYGTSESLPMAMVILVIVGIAGPAIFINFAMALIQENCDPKMMGRVMSTYQLAFMATTPIGYAQAGVMSSLFGPQATLITGGLVASAIGIGAMVLLKPVRNLP